MLKAVIFDLDDTLIPEKQYIMSGFRHVSKIMGMKYQIEPSKIYKQLKELFDNEPRRVFNRFLDKHGICYTNEDILSLVEEYRGHMPEIELFEDVVPCLHQLRLHGLRTGIITDGYANAQRQKLKAIKAERLFDEIIITDDLGREFWKPHPKAFELMSSRLDIEYKEMVYVGDNPEKDFYINGIYPVKTVRINRPGGYCQREYFKGIKENHTINDLIDVVNILDIT